MFPVHQIPNIITVVRLFLVPPVVWALLNESYVLGFWLFFAAGFSDGVDGFLARTFGWQSRFGAALDPIADKLLIVLTFFCLLWQELIPWWLFAAILLRDLVIVGGAVAYQWFTQELEMHPLMLGKLNTLLQILVVMVVLLHAGFDWFGGAIVKLVVWVLLISTLVSGGAYILVWTKKLRASGD